MANIVTLYIDDTSLRVLEISGKRIKKWGELPLEMGLAKVNEDIKEAEVAARIKQLLKSRKVAANNAIVGLSGLHCLTRPITLPRLPQAMLAEAVMREAKRVLPVPLEQLYISWQKIPSPEEGKIQVFLVAIPCKTADAILKVLRQVGLKTSLMDLKPLALARVVQESSAIVVDVQSTEFDIVILVDGVPQPVRSMSFSSEKISLQEKLLMVRDELNRTIEFYNSKNPEKPLGSEVTIFVSGELAEEPEHCESLSKEVGHPVVPMEVPLKYPQQFNPTRYMINIGLALKELGKESGPSVVNLNTIPTRYLPKPVSLAKIVAVPCAVAVVSLLILLTMLIREASADVELMRGHLDTTNQILKQRQTQKTELTENIAELEKTVAGVEATRDTFNAALESLEKQGNVINGDLATSTYNLFSPVNLSGISHGGSALILRGSAPSEVEILSYARNLDASGRFSEITITSVRRLSGEGIDFTVILKAEREG